MVLKTDAAFRKSAGPNQCLGFCWFALFASYGGKGNLALRNLNRVADFLADRESLLLAITRP